MRTVIEVQIQSGPGAIKINGLSWDTRILSIGMIQHNPIIRLETDRYKDKDWSITLIAVESGKDMPENCGKYLGSLSWHDGQYSLHYFEAAGTFTSARY